MQFMDESHYDVLFKEDVAVYKPDGSPLLILLKNILSKEKAGLAWSVLKNAKMSMTNNRSTAAGVKSVKWKRQDGGMSGVSRVPRGWEAFSVPVGFFERNIRYPYAHECAWNMHNPDKFEKLFPMLQEASALFETHVPDRFANQLGYVKRTHEHWIIPDTVYSSLTINKNFRTAAHLDAGDLPEGFSNMIVIREGLLAGGNLVLPNWRLAVELDTCDLILFDAHEYHGNTQIVPISKGAVRCSIVCYYRTRLALCRSRDEELEFAKNRKVGDQLFPEETK